MQYLIWLFTGEFGQVCRGLLQNFQGGMDLPVAIKTLNCDASTNMSHDVYENEKVKFLAEATTMGQFEHPNVIRLVYSAYCC